MHADARQYAGFPEAVVLAVPSRRVGGKRHLLQRGTVPPHACATPDLPDRLGTGRRFLDVPSLLRIGAADTLMSAMRPLGLRLRPRIH